jgi:hypothetical protein
LLTAFEAARYIGVYLCASVVEDSCLLALATDGRSWHYVADSPVLRGWPTAIEVEPMSGHYQDDILLWSERQSAIPVLQ